jgi:hypothetical protein
VLAPGALHVGASRPRVKNIPSIAWPPGKARRATGRRRAAQPSRSTWNTGRSGAVVNAQHEAILLTRDRGAIDDDVLRTIERKLDLEEERKDA